MSMLCKHWWGWVRHITRPVDPAWNDGPQMPYLDRYTIFPQRESGANPWRIYLHKFMARDSVEFHNHPSRWSFSVVLWGSYTEEVLKVEPSWEPLWLQPVVRTRRVRWFNWIPADKYHRITTLHPGPGARGVWTLFCCGPLTGRGWGFWRAGVGHVDHSAAEHTKVVRSN